MDILPTDSLSQLSYKATQYS